MNKKTLVREVARHSGMKIEDAERCINGFIDVFRETMEQGGEITIQFFGKFQVAERGERIGFNPAMGEHMVLPPRKHVKFTPSRTLEVK